MIERKIQYGKLSIISEVAESHAKATSEQRKTFDNPKQQLVTAELNY